MFLPGRSAEKEKEEQKRHFSQVEEWSLQIIPAEFSQGTDVSVQEVQCGDPDCAPIDTLVTMFFARYERPMMKIAMSTCTVDDDDTASPF